MRLILIFSVIVSSLLFLAVTGGKAEFPCGAYGAQPCQFVPAPPGQTPACARPGNTYCEHVEGYPTYRIKQLVHRWGYDSKNIIVDETGEEFETHRYRHSASNFYDPSAIFAPPGQNQLGQLEGYKYNSPKIHQHNYQNDGSSDPIYIPKPRETDSLIPQQFGQKINSGYHYGPKVSQYNPAQWLKRFARDIGRVRDFKFSDARPINSTSRLVRSTSEKGLIIDFVDPEIKHRAKRQSPGRTTLCQSTSQYITPQAALNSRGNWMYIVNEMQTARQLVKTETCASTVCSNLCQLPNGYNSRCEQKYVQKRLVALNGDGQNLYTDTFWFPSCCVCTLSN